MRKHFLSFSAPDSQVTLRSKYYGMTVALCLFVWLLAPDAIETKKQSLFNDGVLGSSEISNLSRYSEVGGSHSSDRSTLGVLSKLSEDSILETDPPSMISKVSVSLASGQNLSKLLRQYKLTHRDIHDIEALLTPYIPPRNLQVGHQIDLNVNNGEALSLQLDWEFAKKLHVSIVDDRWALRVIDVPTDVREFYAAGVISTSLYQSALKQQIPTAVIKGLITAYSHVVDFQRAIKPGDEFKVLYSERYIIDKPEVKQIEQLSYVELVLSGESMPLINYQNSAGALLFYDINGKLADNFLMKNPVNGAHLTSYFGYRRHPILGYSRQHKGIDFGAPINTPVMAAGHGTIEKIGNESTFGKRIKINHGNGFHTLYAHLNGFAAELKQGSKVQQGDVIGYLGNTGLSRARHLHYEVHEQGRAINPLTLKQTASVKLSGDELAEFNQVKQGVLNKLTHYQSKYILDIADSIEPISDKN